MSFLSLIWRVTHRLRKQTLEISPSTKFQFCTKSYRLCLLWRQNVWHDANPTRFSITKLNNQCIDIDCTVNFCPVCQIHVTAPPKDVNREPAIFCKPGGFGPWWWSSGQRPCLPLRQSEFESFWQLKQFSVRKGKNKRKRDRGWLAHQKKLRGFKLEYWSLSSSSFLFCLWQLYGVL